MSSSLKELATEQRSSSRRMSITLGSASISSTAFCLPFILRVDESAAVVADEGDESRVSSTNVLAESLEEERVLGSSGGGRATDEELGEYDDTDVREEARGGREFVRVILEVDRLDTSGGFKELDGSRMDEVAGGASFARVV